MCIRDRPDLDPATGRLVDVAEVMRQFTVVAAEREEDVHDLVQEVFDRPIDHRRGVLFHAVLARLAPDVHVFVFGVDHLVFDRFSAQVLMTQLGEVYVASLSGLPDPSGPRIGFWDAAARQDRATGERTASFWHDQFDRFGLEPRLHLPERSPGSAGAMGPGARVAHSWPLPVGSGFEAVFARLRMTLFELGLAALLAADTATGAIQVGAVVPLANRPEPWGHELIGFFSHPVNVYAELPPDLTVLCAAEVVREAFRAAVHHSGVPMRELYSQRDPNYADRLAPGAYLYCDFLDTGPDRVPFGPVHIAPFELDDSMVLRNHGAVNVMVTRRRRRGGSTAGGSLDLWARYSVEAFREDTVRDYLARAASFLQALATDPTVRLGALGATGPWRIGEVERGRDW